MTHASSHRHFLPGMGKPWLLPLYDPLTRVLGARAVHARLLEQAAPREGDALLEIGCGTANLLLMAARRAPGVTLTGLDPDAAALARARRKAARAGVPLALDAGFADRLPYADGSFTRVLSSLMLHHLEPEDRLGALREARRVLRPGGSLHVADFGGAASAAGGGLLGRLAHRAPRAAHGGADGLLGRLGEAGYDDAALVGRQALRFGEVLYWRAVR
jgi:ubiquinone/menaquinone biosynthesis C-methylase UbiE